MRCDQDISVQTGVLAIMKLMHHIINKTVLTLMISAAVACPVYAGWQQNSSGQWTFQYNNETIRDKWIHTTYGYYHMDANGIMQTGWAKVHDTWYYFKESGLMNTGWRQINGDWYYMDGKGAMQTGWQYLKNADGSSSWYYLKDYGGMATGWRMINDKWYYFNSDGKMLTGWAELPSGTYYLTDNGDMLSNGNYTIGGKEYHFAESGALINP